MQTSDNGRKFLEQWEGLRLTSYQDQAGVWTIGYGSTTDVWSNMTITQQDADFRLAIDLHRAEVPIYDLVECSLNQNNFDALVSLVYNIGAGAFKGSTVLRLLNVEDYIGAADAFLLWNKVNGKTNQGLVNRRTAERALFLMPTVGTVATE